MTGFTENRNGRYKCNFCDHATYKTWGGANNHVEQNHPKDLELARALQEIDRLKNQPPKERIVYRDNPQEAKPEYWDVPGIYCSTCKSAWRGGRIPRGQTVENTPHSVCGTKSLMLVLEIN